VKSVTVSDVEKFLQISEHICGFATPVTLDLDKPFARQKVRLEGAFECAWVACVSSRDKRLHLDRMKLMIRNSLDLMAAQPCDALEARQDVWRGYHDLWTFHVAALIGDQALLNELASLATYAKGDHKACCTEEAWAGVWKFSISGQLEKAQEQALIMYRAPKPRNLRLPRQMLVRAWLACDWKSFDRGLKLTYRHLWNSAARRKRIVRESSNSIEINLATPSTSVDGSWQEIAFGLQALKQQAVLTFDPLFFPPRIVDYPRLLLGNGNQTGAN
jgi:hypothetical protein